MYVSADVKVLETPRLWLRPLALSDAAAYEKHFVDYEVIRFLAAQVPWPYPEGGIEHFLRTVILPAQGRDRWAWALSDKHGSGECIGAIEMWRDGTPEHRGFWLGRSHWGRGLMTEAAAAVTDHAFEALDFERLVFTNALGNERSRRVKEKAGARLIRIEAGSFVDPAFKQREIWELTRADWQARRA